MSGFYVTVRYTEQVTEDRWERHCKTTAFSGSSTMEDIFAWAKRVSGYESMSMNQLTFTDGAH